MSLVQAFSAYIDIYCRFIEIESIRRGVYGQTGLSISTCTVGYTKSSGFVSIRAALNIQIFRENCLTTFRVGLRNHFRKIQVKITKCRSDFLLSKDYKGSEAAQKRCFF